MQDEELEPAAYASPPCFMHELSLDYRMADDHSDAWRDVSRWRRAERERLIQQRLSMPPEDRAIRSSRIANRLDRALGQVSGRVVGSYWPLRGEPDLRNWGIGIVQRGGRLALPVVVEKGCPLEYRVWIPGDPLERGVWDIPVPIGGPAVHPDVIIAPAVGFDDALYRLGYGGGFFDRTLAAMARKPQTVGVGFAESQIRTIYPQPHDIPMDVIVTD